MPAPDRMDLRNAESDGQGSFESHEVHIKSYAGRAIEEKLRIQNQYVENSEKFIETFESLYNGIPNLPHETIQEVRSSLGEYRLQVGTTIIELRPLERAIGNIKDEKEKRFLTKALKLLEKRSQTALERIDSIFNEYLQVRESDKPRNSGNILSRISGLFK